MFADFTMTLVSVFLMDYPDKGVTQELYHVDNQYLRHTGEISFVFYAVPQ